MRKKKSGSPLQNEKHRYCLKCWKTSAEGHDSRQRYLEKKSRVPEPPPHTDKDRPEWVK